MSKYCEGCKNYGYTKGINQMSEYCKGCRSHASAKIYSVCVYTDFNQNSECPCSVCIVKVICMTGCELFDFFETHCSERKYSYV